VQERGRHAGDVSRRQVEFAGDAQEGVAMPRRVPAVRRLAECKPLQSAAGARGERVLLASYSRPHYA
jgi:hypothetical protein